MTISRRLRFEDALKPICVWCKKEVDSMKKLKDSDFHSTVVQVHCHGEHREMRINNYWFGQLHRGVAFTDKFANKIDLDNAIKKITQTYQLEHQC